MFASYYQHATFFKRLFEGTENPLSLSGNAATALIEELAKR